METRQSLKIVLTTGFALLFGFVAQVDARQAAKGSHRADVKSVRIASNEIGGVVNGAKGPEAGVWVIAETSDLPMKFRRIVVTDDQGRFLIPDLPKASYKVWVRGYGLLDSSPVESSLGKNLALKAASAPDAKTAAQVYPANYWLSLLKIPPKSDFSPSPAAATSRPPTITSQAGWISQAKSGCQTCHQLGDRATREIEPELGKFDSAADAWNRRVKSGQMGPNMSSGMNMFGRD